MKAENRFTHIDNLEDWVYLKKSTFPVNMRLFHSNPEYKSLIDHCCTMIINHALYDFEDYKKPHGMSGANLAIPFNIIGIVNRRGQKDEFVEILINPIIVSVDPELIETTTNCGSIRLANPIKIKRFKTVTVNYFNSSGEECQTTYRRYSYTIQHEIDHNNGVLITDRITT